MDKPDDNEIYIVTRKDVRAAIRFCWEVRALLAVIIGYVLWVHRPW